MPKQLDYCFIVTYGRSGSTLLQGLLNAIPGWCIRGENGGAIKPLFELYEETKKRVLQRARSRSTTTLHPWYGMDRVNLEELLEYSRRLLTDVFIQPAPDDRVVGFKEVRYNLSIDYRLSEVMDFMTAVFPGARFVFNERNLDDTSSSGWWPQSKKAQVILSQALESMREAYELHQANAFWVDYDAYKHDVDSLRALFTWLGESFDREALEAVISQRHSY